MRSEMQGCYIAQRPGGASKEPLYLPMHCFRRFDGVHCPASEFILWRWST